MRAQTHTHTHTHTQRWTHWSVYNMTVDHSVIQIWCLETEVTHTTNFPLKIYDLVFIIAIPFGDGDCSYILHADSHQLFHMGLKWIFSQIKGHISSYNVILVQLLLIQCIWYWFGVVPWTSKLMLLQDHHFCLLKDKLWILKWMNVLQKTLSQYYISPDGGS